MRGRLATFYIDPDPGLGYLKGKTKVTLRVIIVSSVVHVRKLTGDPKSDCWAFCRRCPDQNDANVEIVLPISHKRIRPGLVSHEAMHAAPRLIDANRKGNKGRVEEEELACMVGRLTQAMIQGLEKYDLYAKRKKR